MKILYNIAGTYRSGGMERVLANKANWLVAHQYDVVIATTDQCGRLPFFYLDNRIKCYDLYINYEQNNNASIVTKIIQFPYKQFLHKKRLSSLIKNENPDIVISMFCNDVYFITDINDNSKKILEIHFSKYKRIQYGRKGLWRLIDIYLSWQDEKNVNKFDDFIVLTQEDKGYWKGAKNITVIPNALAYIHTETSNLTHKKAIAVGRLTYQKGFDRLIKIWAEVHMHRPEWMLDIVGEGEDKDMLENLIKKYNLECVVHLVPPTLNIEQKYLDSSFLIMTSRYEGFGLVLIEAHSYGLPTLSFNCKCGPSDIIVDGVNGFLIEDGDLECMKERIFQLIDNYSLRKLMGEAAKDSSMKYAEEKVMNEWVKLFEKHKIERT